MNIFLVPAVSLIDIKSKDITRNENIGVQGYSLRKLRKY